MARGLISMAAFAGGTVAALLASRLLPPLVAQGVGPLRDSGDPFESLIRDHRHFEELLHEMTRTDIGALRRGMLLQRLKRGLTKHALAEEDVVYPLLHEHRHEPDGLYADHAEIKMHLHALEQIPKDDPRWTARVRQLQSVITEHARLEEQVEFPRLRAAMDDEESSLAARHVHRERAMVL